MAEPIKTKTCRVCKEIKPLSEFHKRLDAPDGRRNNCKICKYARQKQYRQTDKGKATLKRYRQGESGELAQKRYRQSKKGKKARNDGRKRYSQKENGIAAQKRYDQSEKGRVRHLKYHKKYKATRPEQIKAKTAVAHAIKKGVLPRPDTLSCHYCPKQAKDYHHHKGYEPEHWLDVVPTCIKCHRKHPNSQ